MPNRMRSTWVFLALLLACAGLTQAQSWAPERRKDQFPSDQSYLVLPAPYSLPGLGAGIGIVAYETNFGFYNQSALIYLTGDDEGLIADVTQVQLIERRLLLDVQYLDLYKTRSQEFTSRGMNTTANEFIVLDGAYTSFQSTLTLTTEDRRWAACISPYQAQSSLRQIRDNAGNVTARFSPPLRTYQVEDDYGATMDLTDDKFDPRRGIRLELKIEDFPRTDPTQPDFYVTDASASAYVPVGRINTWALNYFRSDAQVRSAGLTNPAAIAVQQGIFCAPGDAQCQAAEAARINNVLAANTNGSSDSLGGQHRLRAYPQSRFQGAHTEYFSSEFRINLTDEVTPFNYGFFKGIRTAFQIAPFYEVGSVSETAESLWAQNRSDYGVGGRMVTASGAVYRFDVAVGNEGTNTTIIVDYPW